MAWQSSTSATGTSPVGRASASLVRLARRTGLRRARRPGPHGRSSGWRPALELIKGPGLRGSAGVLQAEQNLLIHLSQLPDARGLRLVIDSQPVLSNDLAERVKDDFPSLVGRWGSRAATYTKLAKECRNLAGLIGDGRNASTEGSVLLSRLRKVPAFEPLTPEKAKAFVRLFHRIDSRITVIIARDSMQDNRSLR